MGLGIFDNRGSNGAPENKISNIMAINPGVTFKPADKMTLVGDVWYAALSEDDVNGETDLGLELDGKLSYALMDNLNADFVLAYLFAGPPPPKRIRIATGSARLTSRPEIRASAVSIASRRASIREAGGRARDGAAMNDYLALFLQAAFSENITSGISDFRSRSCPPAAPPNCSA